MIRAKLWFRCAVVHDPVTPMVVRPALISWEAKSRRIDLIIERAFNGEELVRRMKGWVTVDPSQVIEIIKEYLALRAIAPVPEIHLTEKGCPVAERMIDC